MLSIKDIIIISVLTSILFVLEQVLTFIPNVQMTFLLIIVFSKVLKTYKTLIIILIHVLLDNIFMGSFNIIFIPFMLIGYSIIPILLNTCFKKVESETLLAFLSIMFSFIYCFMYIIPNVIIMNINILDYIIADLPFTIILSISSFVSVLWLFRPLKNKLEQLI